MAIISTPHLNPSHGLWGASRASLTFIARKEGVSYPDKATASQIRDLIIKHRQSQTQ